MVEQQAEELRIYTSRGGESGRQKRDALVVGYEKRRMMMMTTTKAVFSRTPRFLIVAFDCGWSCGWSSQTVFFLIVFPDRKFFFLCQACEDGF